jgi:hypothetical protein
MSFVRATQKNGKKIDIRTSAIVAIREDNAVVVVETEADTFEVIEGMQAIRNRIKKSEAGAAAEEE